MLIKGIDRVINQNSIAVYDQHAQVPRIISKVRLMFELPEIIHITKGTISILRITNTTT